ncbi:MAG: nucleotidyltransferase domain-containing protein, partial [Pseudomonadota bacterium]
MALAKQRNPGEPERTFTGLAHLIASGPALADHEALISQIDALAAEATDHGALRRSVVELLAGTLQSGRAAAMAAFLKAPLAGLRCARALAHVTDCVVAATVHLATQHLHPLSVRTKGEHLSIVAVGGYGRGEMAPFSDVDLLFLTPYKQTAWSESVIESTLYVLWDLKLKVGQSTRSIDDCLRLARDDI